MMPLVEKEPLPPEGWAEQAWPRVEFPCIQRGKRSISYHEAGHVVLCLFIGIPIKYACVDATPSTHEQKPTTPGGRVRFDTESMLNIPSSDVEIDRLTMKRVAHGYVSMYMAGYQAELLLHGLDVRGWINLDVPDYSNSKKILSALLGHDLGIYYCQRFARFVLSSYWPLVMTIADEIESKGKISRARISSILNTEANREHV